MQQGEIWRNGVQWGARDGRQPASPSPRCPVEPSYCSFGSCGRGLHFDISTGAGSILIFRESNWDGILVFFVIFLEEIFRFLYQSDGGSSRRGPSPAVAAAPGLPGTTKAATSRNKPQQAATSQFKPQQAITSPNQPIKAAISRNKPQ